MRKHCAQLAQLVEQRTENPCVSGSIPELGILIYYGILAQVVEHLTFNQVVRGSNPRCLIRKRYHFDSAFFVLEKKLKQRCTVVLKRATSVYIILHM